MTDRIVGITPVVPTTGVIGILKYEKCDEKNGEEKKIDQFETYLVFNHEGWK